MKPARNMDQATAGRQAGTGAPVAPDDIQYDERGGILNTLVPTRRARAPEGAVKVRKGYGPLERWLLRKSPRINYLLDEGGRYHCRAEAIPPVIRLGVTNRCTARCFYCPRELIHGWQTGYMDFEAYTGLIDWAARTGVGAIGFALWGEPLLHPRLLEMIGYAQRAGLKLRLSTNAIALDREMAEGLLGYPFEAIEVSMDGYTRDEFLAGKQVDRYSKTLNNILGFLDLARERGVKTVFNVHFVDAGTVSMANKLRFVRFWKKQLRGLNYNTTFYYEPHNWAGARADLAARRGWTDRLLGRWELKKPCRYVRGLNVNFDGTAFVCANNAFAAAELGNVFTTPPQEVYARERRLEFLKENESGAFRAEGCAACTVNSIFPLLFIKKRIINALVSRLS